MHFSEMVKWSVTSLKGEYGRQIDLIFCQFSITGIVVVRENNEHLQISRQQKLKRIHWEINEIILQSITHTRWLLVVVHTTNAISPSTADDHRPRPMNFLFQSPIPLPKHRMRRVRRVRMAISRLISLKFDSGRIFIELYDSINSSPIFSIPISC